jgi:diaminopimelate decarboxylase
MNIFSGKDLTPTVMPLADTLVTDNFGVRDGVLTVGGLAVDDLAETFGSPLYVYDGDVIERRYRALTAALAGFADVYYSIKANPNPSVVRLLVEAGAGLEVASGAELLIAEAAGASAGKILFAGPGKGLHELDLAIARGIGEIHVESFEEIKLAAELASAHGRVAKIAIRINPTAAAQGGAMRMGGKPTAFGFDEETIGDVLAAVSAHPSLELTGVHLFAGTQILDADVLLAQWAYGLKLAAAVAHAAGKTALRIDLGGGLGIPYHDGDKPLDLGAVSEGAIRLNRERMGDPVLAASQILIEPGRYLTGPAGVYLSRVRAVKISRGQRFIIGDGGMHHHLAASGNLGQIIKRDYPIVAASLMANRDLSRATVAGPLCTPLDTLGRQAHLPEMRAGDLLAILQSGAYGLTASPVGFLSHPMPAEVLVRDGTATLIRPAGDFSAPMVNAAG